MRTTQVSLSIEGPVEKVKVYSDAHGFWEAVVGAHSETAMVLRELEKLYPGKDDPAGLQREAIARIKRNEEERTKHEAEENSKEKC
ncbi:MAG: hypothetical protein LBD23_00120 [Oscillospiraceae bacterium]|jgi:hypothetical protein|nr:hypothetical protein [Oscillospiraceae bacterium]